MKLSETIDVSMCVDCAMFHANGELPDSATSERVHEISHPRGLTNSDTGELFSCVVSVTGDETYFSWDSCDLCGQSVTSCFYCHGVTGDETYFSWDSCDLCGQRRCGGDRTDGVIILI